VLSSISLLTGEGSAPTQQQAAERARMDRQMASKIIAALEQKALITRVPDPGDARARRLHLTTAGRQALRASIAAARQADAEIFANTADTQRLIADLRTIAEHRTAGRHVRVNS